MAELWVTTKTAADILGISDRAVRKGIRKYKYIEEKSKGGKSGVVYKIALSSLPGDKVSEFFRKGLSEEEKKVDLSFLSEEEREELLFKIQVVKDKGRVADVVKRYGISERSLFRWRKIYREEGIRGFFPNKSVRENAEWDSDAKDFFLGLYLSENKRDIMFCYKMMKKIGEEKGWVIPSYPTVYRYVSSLPDYQKRLREGKKSIEDNVFPYIERDYKKMKPGDWWVSDHHQLDVAVNLNGKIIFPWITAWYDMKSRKILSFIFVETPNMNSINITLREAIRLYGKPKNVLIDNGKDYRAKIFQGGEQKIRILNKEEVIRIKGLYEVMGIKAHFAIPYNAKSKPIERWFKTLEGQFGKIFRGYRGSNTKERPEKLVKEIKNKEVFTLDMLQKLMKFYVSEYNNEKRKVLQGRSAEEVFKEAVLEKVDERELLLLTLKWKRALKMKRNGLFFLDQWYRNDNYYEYIGKYVVPKYDPFDVSKIYVFDTEGRFLFEMERVGKGASLEEEIKEITRVKRRIRNSLKRNEELVKKSQEEMERWILEKAGVKREDELIIIEKKREERKQREEEELGELGEKFLESLSKRAKNDEDETNIFNYI